MAEFVKIVELRDEVIARLLESVLKDRGIPHVIRTNYDRAFDGVFQLAEGWGHIEALEEHREAILDALEELSQEPLGDDGDEDDDEHEDEDYDDG